jgi:hypothetical protein
MEHTERTEQTETGRETFHLFRLFRVFRNPPRHSLISLLLHLAHQTRIVFPAGTDFGTRFDDRRVSVARDGWDSGEAARVAMRRETHAAPVTSAREMSLRRATLWPASTQAWRHLLEGKVLPAG